MTLVHGVGQRIGNPGAHADHRRLFDVELHGDGVGGGRGAQKARFKLLAVGAVVDPFARGGDPLTGGNGSGMADHGHDVTMPTRLGAQNAEAILGVMIGDALNEIGQHLLG